MAVTRYSDEVIQAQRTQDGNMHQSLLISIGICTQFMPLMFCLTVNKFWISFSNSCHRFALGKGKNDKGVY